MKVMKVGSRFPGVSSSPPLAKLPLDSMALPMKKAAAMKAMKAKTTSMKAMKAMKVMKAKRVSVIAKGKRARVSVFNGKKEKTQSGMTKASLVKRARVSVFNGKKEKT